MFLQQRIHFIGIGGIGMSAIAKILFQKGFIISGSDKSENNIVRDLRKKGIKVFNSHINSNLGNSDVVVYSSAINKNNPELKEARKKNTNFLESYDACRGYEVKSFYHHCWLSRQNNNDISNLLDI